MKFLTSRFLFFALILVVLFGTLSFTLYIGLKKIGPHSSPPRPTPLPQSKVISHENSLPGTTDWQIPAAKGATIEIQAYAGATSVAPEQTLSFYVSTLKEGTEFSVDIYRLGWYNGQGGRLMSTQSKLKGFAQGYYDPKRHQLINCTSCLFDQQTGLVEAHWLPSYTLTIPNDWLSGVYLAKFTEASKGMQTYVPFDVSGNNNSVYVAVTANTTYQAYNTWGGYSLYEEDSSVSLESDSNQNNAAKKAVKVSFDRPYVRGFGSGDLLLFEIDAIRWMERRSYDVSYISSVDLHSTPSILFQHRAYISLGHDEYWTLQMRNAVENARNHGVSLAFLGANAAYWQMRFEADTAGMPYRTIVCYKVESKRHNLDNDPMYFQDKSLVTTLWRDPILARPENALIGIMYASNTFLGEGFPWQLSPDANSPLLKDTSLQAGQLYGCNVVGYEWDHVFSNGATPAGLQIIARSKVVTDYKAPDFSNTTYYYAPSGAMVFASGSIYWSHALDFYRFTPDTTCPRESLIVPGIQLLMEHIMLQLITYPSATTTK